MKKLITILVIIITFTFTSCEKFSGCGIVTYSDLDCNEYGCTYYLYVKPDDGSKEQKVKVSERTWMTTYWGDTYCQ